MLSSKNVNDIEINKFMLGPILTNCYLLSTINNDVIIIDPPENNGQISEFISNNNLNPTLIINTHGHIDHIYGNNYFKKKYNIPLAIHKDDIPLLNYDWNSLSTSYPSDYKSTEADMVLEDNIAIEFGDSELIIIHTPGHSPGSISIQLDGVIFSGDTLFREGIGRYDLPGGSSDELFLSIKSKLFKLPDNIVVYTGHGENTTIGYEKNNNPFFSSKEI